MEQGQTPRPPDELRPWYYRNWFLYPAFILGWPVWLNFQIVLLWPAWSILIIRSPWHRGFLTGTLAWAMLMSGGALIGLQFVQFRANPVQTLILVAPGLILTVITQFLWARYKKKLPAVESGPAPAPMVVKGPPRSRQERQRRRIRRRGTRPGRSSRHPL